MGDERGGLGRITRMAKLLLAMGIADAIEQANRQGVPINAEALAEQLLEAHPETDASWVEIVEVLRQEAACECCS